MKPRRPLILSIVVIGLLTGCGTYPFGVPLGLTQAEINSLPPAKRAIVRATYRGLEAKADRPQGTYPWGDIAAWRQARAQEVINLESLNRTNDRFDSSPGAVR